MLFSAFLRRIVPVFKATTKKEDLDKKLRACLNHQKLFDADGKEVTFEVQDDLTVAEVPVSK